ncbi:ABC transporter permease [Streptomyces europaeiscabiei]|uniref:ABC transporter permease n=1 Tax=Streptomyces europaeiscabiei TaxID=146819 RepID=UPI0029B97E38|nr:ABC transporter permease [Streptomyces europaeiscabiei]MDX3847489.1 ABC transporter permease [Streptomyces europaeiscabiei]
MTTTINAPAPVTRGGPRPCGLVRTVLRLHRSALLVWCAYVLLMVGWMLWLQYVTGAEMRAERNACRERESGCIDIESAFAYSQGMSWVGTLIAYFSYAVAAWAGASLTGRELERGTARLAWTQSVTPVRWLTAKLAVSAAALTAGTAVLVLVYRWAWSSNRDLSGDEWYYTDPFVNRGPAVLAYALCALAVGALAGLALQRALPALAVAFGFMLWFHLWLDGHSNELWPTKTLTGTAASRLPMTAEQLDLGAITGPGGRANDLTCFDADADVDYTRCMSENGFTDLYAEVHPVSHFWPLHLMTTGVILALAVLATAAAYWTLRRRAR